ncbi:MAG: DUF429 domain-containing protein [Acidimicrobiales bacterium]|nr:DUF429 domain-containing protein [Acidimicrobiales bacterium]
MTDENPPTPDAVVAGVDASSAGWVVVTTTLDFAATAIAVVDAIAPIIEQRRSGALCALGIDMPMGLPTVEPRASDAAARAFIGPRRAAVFPTPIRAVLDHVDDYPAANAVAKERSGRGLSKQAFNLLPRVAELDEALGEQPPSLVAEVHPECCFAALAGGPDLASKKSAAGVGQRLRLLMAIFGSTVVDHLAAMPPGVAPDDVLDACAVAWTATRLATGTARPLGNPDARDERRRPMVIWV